MQKSGLEVRAATVTDRAAAIRFLSAQLVELKLPVDEEGIARAVELALSPSGIAWLAMATLAGLPVGILLANPIVSVEHGGGALWIEELYVAPPHRRRGVARALIEYMDRQAHNVGLRALELEVTEDSEPALALYQSLGFSILPRRRLHRA